MVENKAATVDSAYVLTALAYVIILTRLALRRLKHERFKVDDYLMGLAMVFYALNTAVYPVAEYNGNNISQSHPKDLSPEDVQRVTLGSKLLLIERPFYMSYLWTLKTCLLIFYTRLTERTNELLAIKVVGGVLFATWLANMLTFFLECRPIHLAWQVLPETPECAKAIGAVYCLGLTNIVTDLLLMSIPIRIIIRSKLSMKTKLELVVVFTLGAFVVIVSMLRMVIVLTHWTQQNKLVWGQIECFTATIVANAPILHGLWKHSFIHIRQLKFGKTDECPPEYNVAVRQPTPASGAIEMSDQEPRPPSRRDRARQSMRRFRDRLRASLDVLEIERSVELLQESKTGRFDRGSQEEAQFSGLTPVAHITTHIGTGLTSGSKKTAGMKSMFIKLKGTDRSEA